MKRYVGEFLSSPNDSAYSLLYLFDSPKLQGAID